MLSYDNFAKQWRLANKDSEVAVPVLAAKQRAMQQWTEIEAKWKQTLKDAEKLPINSNSRSTNRLVYCAQIFSYSITARGSIFQKFPGGKPQDPIR